jgi:hypothetical protein
MAHKILYEALLAETAEEGRRAVEAMRAPDVGELATAKLHFYLADGDGRPVPFVEARGRVTAAVAAAIPDARETGRDGFSIVWKVPDRHDHVRVYTRQCRHHSVGGGCDLAKAAMLARFPAHLRLSVDTGPPEKPAASLKSPEGVGRFLADLTRAMHDCGAVRHGHAFRMCPTTLYEAGYRLSPASLAAIDHVLPVLKDRRIFLETHPEDPDAQRHVLAVRFHGETTPLLVLCAGGPVAARDILRHAEQKRLVEHERVSLKALEERKTITAWYVEDIPLIREPNHF